MAEDNGTHHYYNYHYYYYYDDYYYHYDSFCVILLVCTNASQLKACTRDKKKVAAELSLK